jgi:hypothetical protein
MDNLQDLTPIYEKNKGKWVALNPENGEVVVSSTSAKIAYKKSKSLGINVPVLFKVPKKHGIYVG